MRRAAFLPCLLIVVGCSSSGGSGGTTTPPATGNPTPTATVTATTTTSQGSSQPSTLLCAPSNTRAHFYGGQGAAGTEFAQFVVTNVANRPCRTGGYPGFALLRNNGKPRPTKVRRDPSKAGDARPGPKFFRVPPGGDFYVEVHYSFAAPDCANNTPPSSSQVWLTLPDNRDHAVVPLHGSDIAACDGILDAYRVFHHLAT